MAKYVGGGLKYYDVRVHLTNGQKKDLDWSWTATDNSWLYVYRRSGRVVLFNKDMVEYCEYLRESVEEESNG